MSVRSIIGGDLTLANLNVTTINDLAYPPASGAGTVVLSSGTAAVNMPNNVVTTLDTITLTAGVWHIMTASSVSCAGTTITTFKTSFSSATISYMSATKIQQTLTVSLTTNVPPYLFSDCCVITLTATTVLTYSAYSLQSGGTIGVDNPDITSGAYITATNLA
jgi:hypothetical protein